MAIYIYWFVLALVLLGLEMVTGTFYLLVVSIAAAVGGFAALAGMSIVWQLTLCALTVITGTVILRRWKKGRVVVATDSSLDVGQPVKVLAWPEQGPVRVFYRGAEWNAEPESADMPRDGTLYIKTVRGSSLVLTHRKLQDQ